nr:ABC transporter ATP-binding protein [bacterium]
MATKPRLTDDEAIERPFQASQWWRLLSYLKPYRLQMAVSIVLLIVAAVASLGQLRLLTAALAVVQQILPQEAGGPINEALLPKLYGLVLAILGCTIAGGISYFFRTRLMETAGRKAIATLRHDLFGHLQTLSLAYFDGRPAGKLLVRVINDVNSLNDLFTNGIVNTLVDCVTLVIIVLVMLLTSVSLTLVAMSTIPILMVMVFVMRRRMRRAWQEVRRKSAVVNAYLHESLAGMRVTQAFAREDENYHKFHELVSNHRASWLKACKINNIFWASTDVVGTLGTVLLYLVGVNLLQDQGGAMIETLMTMVWFMGRFWGPINNLSNFYNNILVAMASTERIFEIIDTPPDIASEPDAERLPDITGQVTFDHVVFGYDADKVILNDVSFDIPAGSTIALVGPTGAGKSTIVNLISRFYDPQGGRVLIDGHDIKEMDLHSVRSQMGIMLQDSFIFSGTIMDNIRYGRLDATDEEVMAAAKAVLAHDFIMETERGYQTEVNERGSQLSIGQRQLISFARALLADPRILILDEATSSIDTKTERIIQMALERLLEGRTSFVIAHRLSTIRKADKIMVIAGGGIAESGTHKELMAMPGGIYRGLCEAQYRFLNAG